MIYSFAFFTFYGHIINLQCDQLLDGLASLFGRALHRYRRGCVRICGSGLNLFLGFKFTTAFKLCVYLRWPIMSSYRSPQFKYIIFQIFSFKTILIRFSLTLLLFSFVLIFWLVFKAILRIPYKNYWAFLQIINIRIDSSFLSRIDQRVTAALPAARFGIRQVAQDDLAVDI